MSTLELGGQVIEAESLARLEGVIQPSIHDNFENHEPRQFQRFVQGASIIAARAVVEFSDVNRIEPKEAGVECLGDHDQYELWEMLKNVDWSARRGKKNVKEEDKDRVEALKAYMGKKLFEG